MEFYCLGGGLANNPDSGGMMTDLRRGERWPNNVSSYRYISENHIERQVRITCGFLVCSQTGAILSGDQRNIRIRVDENTNSVVVAQQVSSLLMLPRNGVIRIIGNPELDELNNEHLHLFVTEVEHDLGHFNSALRYAHVQRTVVSIANLLSEDIPDELRNSIDSFLSIWGYPDPVRSGELRERLSRLENNLASAFDGYAIDDDIVQFLTGEQSPVYTPSSSQVETPLPPPLPQAATAIPASLPAWLESNTHGSSGTSNSSNPSGPRSVRPGRLYLRVVLSVDDSGNPIDIYPMFKHGTFRTTENTRSRRGYTDLPPRDSQNHRLVSRFCAVSGLFPDNLFNERVFSNRLVGAGFTIEQGIGGQSEWHRFNGETNQERYVELLNAIEVLENYSNENEVQFERRNILEQLELNFNEE